MKIHEIVGEGTVTNITAPVKRTNSHLTPDTSYQWPSIPGLSSKPLIKPMRRFSSKALRQGLIAGGLPPQDVPEIILGYHLNDDIPYIVVNTYTYDITNQSRFDNVDDALIDKWFVSWKQRLIRALLIMFGTYAKQMEFTTTHNVPVIIVSDQFLDDIGYKRDSRRRLDNVIQELIQRHRIAGYNSVQTKRRSNGQYIVTIAGSELLNANDMKRFEMDLRYLFGDTFIKLTNDGELESLGFEKVSRGLTNYNLYFTKQLKDQYTLS